MFRGHRPARGRPSATLGALPSAPDPRLRPLDGVPAAGAPACSALRRPEFASARCASAAVASLLAPGPVRCGEPPPRTA
ncbi:DUF6629 family protein [Streptomyces sp. NPDC090445]|uniref:DUF6629 family protein n=1 Tax=Streptomyces sp. NPDC090445 TaxID=3365963 RepID=UPI00381D41AB